MTRTVTYRDYLDATGAAVCEMIVRYSVPAAREAGAALIKGQPVDAAYLPTPFGAKGEPFDPPEVVQPPNCDFGSYIAHAAHDAAEGPEGCDSTGCVIPQAVDEH